MRDVSRRTFVAGAVGTAVAIGAGSPSGAAGRRPTPPPLKEWPFTLGVASGDPRENRVVLWTRLAPEPMVTGGGMDPADRRVEWEVGADPGFKEIVRRGRTRARAEHAHSVHVDVGGLRADREYWYRFRIDGHVSPVGRTRTTPTRNARAAALSLGLVSCQRYNSGFYTAYDDLTSAAPDVVVHVGDYIYESGGDGVRTDPLPESISLDEYRNRYGLYKQDPSLQAAHAVAPWMFTWDDHEVENNHAGLVPEDGSTTPDPADFLARRAAAYKAYWEHMPLRGRPPTGPDLRIHRSMRWGRLAELLVLDTRQFRSDQCGEVGPACTPEIDATMEMIGADQQRWLERRLRKSRATWAVLAQQVVFSRMNIVPGGELYNLDQWDGYRSARDRVLAALNTHHPTDNVVLTGDIHASGVADLKADAFDDASAVIGAEFVGTSVSSGGNTLLGAALPFIMAANPHIKWADVTKRGWVHHTVSADEWRADYRHVDDATVPDSPVSTATSWSLPRGGAIAQV